MIRTSDCIVFDIDGTLCPVKAEGECYSTILPRMDVVGRLRAYKRIGFHIILSTSRNMNTYNGNIGLINANTAPVLIDWLRRHDIPFDEIHFAKPWPGRGGFYVDDRAIRPDEFLALDLDQIRKLVGEA